MTKYLLTTAGRVILWMTMGVSLGVTAAQKEEEVQWTDTFLTDRLPLGCGLADVVYDLIYEEFKPYKRLMADPWAGKTGETGRRIFMYEDLSWFLLFDYFHPRDSRRDVSCLVAKGPKETVWSIFETEEFVIPRGTIGDLKRPHEFE